MPLPIINTRADLDAITGTEDHALFMAHLRGSLFQLVKNDVAQAWEAVADDTTINRFGFIRADFPDAVAPDLPVYSPPESTAPKQVTMKQARLALHNRGLLTAIESAINSLEGDAGIDARIRWEYSSTVSRNDPLFTAMKPVLGMTETQLDDFFTYGSTL